MVLRAKNSIAPPASVPLMRSEPAVSTTEQARMNLEETTKSFGQTSIRIAFSSNSHRRHVTDQYLYDAFEPYKPIHFDSSLLKPNVSLLQLLELSRNSSNPPNVFLHLIDVPAIPRDIQSSPILTACMDIDSFWWTESRIRWSLLFDHAFVWHKTLVPRYQAAGHPSVHAVPHAVDAPTYADCFPESDRPLEIGWVGHLGYGQHARRDRIIGALVSRFKMNELRKRYTKQETADVYRQSKIVVNVARDEFPPEANMRCYEAMAAGALLITQIPSELTDWSFREGEHFIGWRKEAEIPGLVNTYLHNENERTKIARAGREMTMGGFTFQHCRDRMLAVLQEHPNQFFAPARNWPPEKVSLTYLEYYYRYQCVSAALEEFAFLRKANRKSSWKGVPMMLKMLRHSLRALR
jgi:hypothetical protein